MDSFEQWDKSDTFELSESPQVRNDLKRYVEWLKRSYMVKCGGVLKAKNLGGECRSVVVEFATMEQASNFLSQVREGQLGEGLDK